MSNQAEKFYLTKRGLEKLKKECQELQKIAQMKIQEKIPEIFHSEEINPEYLAYQEDNELLQSRLADLKNIIKNAELIKIPSRGKQNIVNLGAKVLVETNGQKTEFEILGSLEANPFLGKISNESPVGKSLLGRRVGDIIAIQPTKKATYKILKIIYKG